VLVVRFDRGVVAGHDGPAVYLAVSDVYWHHAGARTVATDSAVQVAPHGGKISTRIGFNLDRVFSAGSPFGIQESRRQQLCFPGRTDRSGSTG